MASPVSVSVNILDKEYQISCKEEEKTSLLSSAAYVDKKMREIKLSGTTLGTDRIAVLSALNIAHELLNLSQVEQQLNFVTEQVNEIEQSIDDALHRIERA